MGKACGPDGKTTDAVLVINADRANFFRHEDRLNLESTLQEFATRIKLELLLDAVLNKRGK